MAKLKDKVSIITGAGAGIGKAIAQLFAKEGSKVIVADIMPENGKKTAEIINSNGGEAIFIKTDVTSSKEIENMVNLTFEKYNRLDILVNNAGLKMGDSLSAPITTLAEEIWDRIIDANLKSVFLCCKYAIPKMVTSGGGSIINIASNAAFKVSGHAAYSASKGGILSFTRSVAFQFADKNIRVNAICPGAVDVSGRSDSEILNTIDTRNEWATLIKRLAAPSEIASAAVYLASEESSYITATELTVDGGTVGPKLT